MAVSNWLEKLIFRQIRSYKATEIDPKKEARSWVTGLQAFCVGLYQGSP